MTAASFPINGAPEIPSMMATLASYDSLFGPYHPQTLAMTAVLAVALHASGFAPDGRRLLERAVADLTKHHGRHHVVRIRALEKWSALLCQEEDWKAASLVQQELLECRTDLLGRDHPETLAVQGDLCATLTLLTSTSVSIPA